MDVVGPALRRLAAFGERLPVDATRDADALAAAGWTRSDHLADPAAWPDVALRYARSSMGIDGVVPGGSCALQSYAGRVAGMTIGTWVQTGALLDLDAARIWVRLEEGRTVGIAAPTGTLRRRSATVEQVAEELLVRHLKPVVDASRTVSRITPRVAWGNVAASCAGAFGTLHRALGADDRPALHRLAVAFLDAPGWPVRDLVTLRRLDGLDHALPHERHTCCLMRLSSKRRECASCERLTPEVRDRRLRTAALTVAAVPPLAPSPIVVAAATTDG
ncbi:MAG: IucA/IucC family C-terminal-domain containing protein [Solirubrobacteraceae bacterium]